MPSLICDALRLYLRSHITIVIMFVVTVSVLSSNVIFSVSCMLPLGALFYGFGLALLVLSGECRAITKWSL
jgi:hypothetical protein